MTTRIRLILITIVLGLTSVTAMAQGGEDAYKRRLDSLLTLANTLDNEDSLLYVLHAISLTHNNVDSVEKYSIRELELAQKTDAPQMAASAYMTIAWCYYNRYDYNTANSFYFKAMHISDSIGDKRSKAIILHGIANSMAMMSRYIEADDYDQKALQLFIELNDSANISYIYRSLGQTCIDFNMYKTAKRHLLNALEIDLKQHNKANIANDYLYIGTAERSEFDDKKIDSLIVEAKEHSLKALALLKETGDETDLLLTYQDLMSIMLKYAQTQKGNRRVQLTDSSRYFYNEGVKLAKKNGLLESSYDFQIMEARFAIEDKNFNLAAKKLRETEAALDKDSAFVFFYIDLYDVFADLYKATGDYKQAYDYLCKAMKLRNDNFSLSYAIKSSKSEVQSEFDKLRHDRELKDAESRLKQQTQVLKQRIQIVVIVSMLTMVIVFVVMSRRNIKRRRRLGRILERHNQEIALQRDRLALINQQITSSISYAQKIQSSMMPTAKQMTEMFGEMLIIWEPLNIVSGDFYWGTRCGSRRLITVVDCTGHGVPGAFMSMLGMSTLCDIANTRQFQEGQLTAANILDLMRTKVIEALRQDSHSGMSLDGMDMALCIIDDNTLELQYAGAFRPLVIFRDGKPILLKADKMPVGYLNDATQPFKNNTLTLQKGDTAYMFSDGLTDQFGRNERGKETKFSTKRMIGILEEIHQKPFRAQKTAIEKAMTKWRTPSNQKQYPQTDDIIMVGFKI